MKANRKFLTNDSAEVGVGTLIVFIAMVLVAAVAAAVIIGTSGTLQQRAQQTGKEATQEVSSNLKVMAIYGERNASTTNVYNISLHVALTAGAMDHDLTRVIIRYSDGNTTRNYNHSESSTLTATSGTAFVPTWIRGKGVNDVMKSGDLVEIKFNMIDEELPTRTDVQLMLIPEVGTPVIADFTGPSTFGVYKTITLRS